MKWVNLGTTWIFKKKLNLKTKETCFINFFFAHNTFVCTLKKVFANTVITYCVLSI